LAGQDFTLNDFAGYVKTNVRDRLRFNKVKSYDEAVNEMYDKYLDEKIMDYEEKNLENKYADFKALMREYREGILLFEITKREVWDKAAKDSVGLQQFYASNKNKYMWPERVSVIKYNVSNADEQRLISLYKYAQKKGHEKMAIKFKDEKGYKVTNVKMVLDKGDALISELQLKPGELSPLNLNPQPASFYAFDSLIKPSQKTLKEARGYVIADYQDHLEKRWIAELEKMYPVTIDKKVLKSITKSGS
jgi:peptidyl-prolyl cis-trans isomerase SurA